MSLSAIAGNAMLASNPSALLACAVAGVDVSPNMNSEKRIIKDGKRYRVVCVEPMCEACIAERAAERNAKRVSFEESETSSLCSKARRLRFWRRAR